MFQSKPYQNLLTALAESSQLGQVMGLLHWDQETMMPKGALDSRSNQKAALAGILHDKFTDPQLGQWAGQAREEYLRSGEKDLVVEANLREFQREYDRETKVGRGLVKALSMAETKAHGVWLQAKEEKKYRIFEPALAELLQLRKQESQVIDPSNSAYDVQLGKYEVGLTSQFIQTLFDSLKESLIPLIKKLTEASKQPKKNLVHGKFPIEKQHAFALEVSKAIGFDFNRGRMDISVHPFCGGAGMSDVRITTRYQETHFIESLTAVIHETGHALYEQGKDSRYLYQPVCAARSMGVHESQSLLWEKHVGLSRDFWEHFFPKAKKIFSPHLDKISLDDFYHSINIVEPSFIRVDADEVTYPLHVALRFELEKDLMDGKVSTQELPDLWREKMKTYLGITPPDDNQGVLQDVHWSAGLFGYFPTYNLGAIYATQIFCKIEKEIPDLHQGLRKGNFGPLKSWLNKNIHLKGCLLETGDLIREVTGQTINSTDHLDYLNKKYAAIYGV